MTTPYLTEYTQTVHDLAYSCNPSLLWANVQRLRPRRVISSSGHGLRITLTLRLSKHTPFPQWSEHASRCNPADYRHIYVQRFSNNRPAVFRTAAHLVSSDYITKRSGRPVLLKCSGKSIYKQEVIQTGHCYVNLAYDDWFGFSKKKILYIYI